MVLKSRAFSEGRYTDFLGRKKNPKTNLWLEGTKMFTQMEAFLKSEGKTTRAIHSAALKGKQQTWAPSTNPDYYY